MANYPGFFASVILGEETSSNTISNIGDLDVAGLNFALALHESDPPLVERYTTWGLQADTSLVYQTLSRKNQLVIGDAGNLYVLEDAQHTDDGLPISLVILSAPYPIPSDKEPLTTAKRLHEVTWQLRTAPPTGGQLVTISVYDVDDPTNSNSRTITQTTQKANVQLALNNARQWHFRWDITTNQDYDILAIGYKYQVLNRPYAPKV